MQRFEQLFDHVGAVDSAANSGTTVVGEDIDLLVLLCLPVDVKSQPLFFKSEMKQTAKKNHKE